MNNTANPGIISWVHVSGPRGPMWGPAGPRNPQDCYPWDDSKRAEFTTYGWGGVGWLQLPVCRSVQGCSAYCTNSAGWVSLHVGHHSAPSCCGEHWIDTTEGQAQPASVSRIPGPAASTMRRCSVKRGHGYQEGQLPPNRPSSRVVGHDGRDKKYVPDFCWPYWYC